MNIARLTIVSLSLGLAAPTSLMLPFPARSAACSVEPVQLAFGQIDTLSSVGSASSVDLAIDCDQISEGAGTVTICAHLGAGSGGASAGGRLLQGSNAMRYSLYADPGLTQPWGHSSFPEFGNPVRLVLGVTDGEASGTLALYGEVPGAQADLAPGGYASTLSGMHAVFYYDEGAPLACSGSQSTEASIDVLAEVTANCLIMAGDLDFGTMGVIDQNVDAIADISVTCTPGTAFSLSLDDGTAMQSGWRHMRSGSHSVAYGLYLDASRQVPWGGLTTSAGAGSGSEQTYPVYGRIPPQPAAAGSYGDTVVVTIDYD